MKSHPSSTLSNITSPSSLESLYYQLLHDRAEVEQSLDTLARTLNLKNYEWAAKTVHNFQTRVCEFERNLPNPVVQSASTTSVSDTLWNSRFQTFKQDAIAFEFQLKKTLTALENSQITSMPNLSPTLMRRKLFSGSQTPPVESNDYDTAVYEQKSLQDSNLIAEFMIEQGQAVRQNLKKQNENLRGLRQKAQEAFQSIQSSSVWVQVVQKRQITDQRIVYCGMILICLIFYFTWKWYHRT